MALLIKQPLILDGDAQTTIDLWKPVDSVNVDQVGFVFRGHEHVLKTLCDGVVDMYLTENRRHLVFELEPEYFDDQPRILRERKIMQENGYMVTSEVEVWQVGAKQLDIGVRLHNLEIQQQSQ
jgi:hypothetical protein